VPAQAGDLRRGVTPQFGTEREGIAECETAVIAGPVLATEDPPSPLGTLASAVASSNCHRIATPDPAATAVMGGIGAREVSGGAPGSSACWKFLSGTRRGTAMGTATNAEVRTGFGAAIMLGIGDDDNVACVAEHDAATEEDARRWIEQTLPAAAMPDWVHRRPHGTAGAFLFAIYTEGVRVHDDQGGSRWEEGYPDDDAPEHTADLVDGAVRWWPIEDARR
jgi:hypothetical protein